VAGTLPFVVLDLELGGALRLARRRRLRAEDALFAAAQLAMGNQALEQKLRRRNHFGRRVRFGDAERRKLANQTLNLLEVGECSSGGMVVVELHCAAQVEPLLDLLRIHAGEITVVDLAHGRLNQVAHHGVGALHLAFVFELQLAGHSRHRGIDVAHARQRHRFAVHQRAPLGVGDDKIERGDGQALAHAAALVHLLVFAGGESHLLHDLANVGGDFDGRCAAFLPRLLRRDGDALLECFGVMRANLGADAVFERRHDLAARRVVLGVGAEDQGHVERQANRIALNLYVALLHDVEERHLDFGGEVGQLVDGEDASVGARQQSVVHGQLARQVLRAARRLDGVDVAYQVGDSDVRRGQLLHVPVVAGEVCDGSRVALLGDQLATALAQRPIRIVPDFAAGNVGHAFVEQRGERAQDAALGLAAQPQQDEVLLRQHSIDDLRNHRVLVADDAGKERRVGLPPRGQRPVRGGPAAQTRDQVRAHLVFDGARLQASFGELRAGAQFPQGLGKRGCCGHGLLRQAALVPEAAYVSLL